MTEDLMTPGEVAKAFGVYAKTVAAWADAGKIAYITTPGGHRRYLRSDVEALLSRTIVIKSQEDS